MLLTCRVNLVIRLGMRPKSLICMLCLEMLCKADSTAVIYGKYSSAVAHVVNTYILSCFINSSKDCLLSCLKVFGSTVAGTRSTYAYARQMRCDLSFAKISKILYLLHSALPSRIDRGNVINEKYNTLRVANSRVKL